MKKLFMRLFLFTTLIISSSFAQKNPKVDFNILNSVPIKGNYLWAAQTETSNFQYLEFLYFLKKNGDSTKLKEMTPDTSIWNSPKGFSQKYIEFYLRHPAYRNYPVVGITKKQAEAYCDWLEIQLNNYYQKDTKHPVQKVKVRLPSNEEWQLAAKGGNENAIFPWNGDDMRRTDKKFKGAIRANYLSNQTITSSNTNFQDITAPIESYWTNDFGIYNMSGNVAEMLQEEGRTRGGSWSSLAPYLEINGIDEYQGFISPSNKIGFRYFIEIIDFKELKPKKDISFNSKSIDKILQPVFGDSSFLISQFEVTNELYGQFIYNTKNETFTPKNENWSNFFNYSKKLQNDYFIHSDYSNYPVVNISYDDAVEFCKWLTVKYNASKNSKYKNIIFKLPTEEQWEKAALGNFPSNTYPWNGNYLRNRKGEFICNHNPVKDKWIIGKDSNYLITGLTTSDIQNAGEMDGFLITCPVNSYDPNTNNIYNMAGNVSEMIENKTITKGGSWGSFPDKLQIKSSENYINPSPYIGFRFIGVLQTK